jgi:hypothetical protein
MIKKNIGKALIPTLLATAYTIPALASAADPLQSARATSRATTAAEAVKQEVIQVLRDDESDRVVLNIAGQPNTCFRVQFSATGKDDSYAPVPKGEGAIGENGLSSISFELRKLGKDKVYLKVITSDKPNFAQIRVTPKPIILDVEEGQLKEMRPMPEMKGMKGMKGGDLDDLPKVRTPSAVAGVRG